MGAVVRLKLEDGRWLNVSDLWQVRGRTAVEVEWLVPPEEVGEELRRAVKSCLRDLHDEPREGE